VNEIIIDSTNLRRLAFIKYLFSLGLSQSYQPEPLYGASILSFHDSVELFLQLVAEKLNVDKSKREFMAYWEVIDEKLHAKLSQEESMKKLNKARVGLKHHGITPSKSDIESFRVTTAAFFDENCLAIFGEEFKDISMIDIISNERAKKLLKEAKDAHGKGLIDDALQNISLSFEYLISDYEKSKVRSVLGSPFFFGESMAFHNNFFSGMPHEFRGLKVFFNSVTKTIDTIQKAIRILSFGIDYKKYVKFKSIIPTPQFVVDGAARFCYGEIAFNKEDLEYCINFIVESALKLQEFDFELLGNNSLVGQRDKRIFHRSKDQNEEIK